MGSLETEWGFEANRRTNRREVGSVSRATQDNERVRVRVEDTDGESQAEQEAMEPE